MTPAPFASEKWLARLNVAAVGASLAACTAAVFGGAMFASGWSVGIPTLYLGALWAALLRHPATIGGSRVRWGWLASIPLAALNGGVCCAVMFASEHSGVDLGAIFAGLVLGATLGIFLWAPALMVTLACFGLPILWAQRLATRGLAGIERGERILGAVCAVLGLGALATTLARSEGLFGAALGAAGALLGATAFALATLRERRRAAFVARVEAGAVPRFRVDPTPEGKVLVRVESHGAGAYRVADFEEEVCRLDAEGRATEVGRAAKVLHSGA